MVNLRDELFAIARGFDEAGIEYAVCGGLALAIHGYPRATVDIDLLIAGEQLDQAREAAIALGYMRNPNRMRFGEVEIERLVKLYPDSPDYLVLDLIPVTAALDEVWSSRRRVEWVDGELPVTSREGLIAMKRLRSSAQDLADIETLEGNDHGP